MTAPAITQTAIVPQTIEPVVFSLVMFHEDSAKEGAILLKTAIMYSSRPIHFHIVCDETAQQYLEGRLTLLNHPLHNVVVKFYRMSKQSMEDRVAREGAIYTDHSAGISGLMKLFMHEILPDDVEKAIFVDTDAFFLMDPALLWDDFKKWNSSVAISMPFHPDQGAAQWHYASNICSCVMLLDLKKLRALRLMDSSIYREDTSGEFPPAFSPPTFVALFGPPGPDGHYLDVALGDQAYWWAIVSNRTEIYTPLSYDWEVSSCLLDMYGTSLGEDAATEDSERPIMLHLYGTPWENQVVHPKLVHFNCLNTDIYFEAESWLDEKNSLTSRWGSVIDYHVGTKWIWLNRGSASVWVETIVDPLFADQRHAAERAQRSTPPDRR
ncbi:hypothetical protein BV25DRAFT_1804413 [Artomyces pyxidatus]|uniref:Uncharacterized protein n=1 Tax=Artomyces pyxidatus TaxID=48021 RepID=A0ACB8T1W6_9AGAM|nr:hypothetical protein BV25DRAFT_1804413 [Artomyces pyxidatus]